MGRFRQVLGLEESAAVVDARESAAAAHHQVEVLTESIADLERMLDDRGWKRLSAAGEHQFSRQGLREAAEVARVMAVANPLIKRGLGIRQAYVWGQGVGITARANGDEGTQDVNTVVQAFLDDPGNRAALTGDQAQEENERALGTDGNVFIACFTNPVTGYVQARTVPFDEITDVILNPDDRDDPWFYERTWVEQRVDTSTARLVTTERKAYYPALTYRPATRVRSIDKHEVMWDAPIHHVSANRLDGWKFGIGDAYAALPFARLYRDFLADWATLVKALSQFAWRATGGNGAQSQKLRAKLARRPQGDAIPGNEGTVGATFTGTPEVTLEAIPKTGATIDSESGRPLAAMAAAAIGVPVTILLADPGQVGSRATAETLDLPTRLEMTQRRSLWENALTAVLTYVITQAVKAKAGPLQGTVTRDPYTGREVLTLAGDTDATVEFDWPPLDEVPVEKVVEAIVKADTTKTLPPVQIAKLLLSALGVGDIDEILDELTDDNGQWLDPYKQAGDALGDAATAAFRRGQDPAAVLRGDEQ